MAGLRGDAPPLWTADEVQTIVGGSWLRRPGPGWNPKMVRSTLVSDILPGWRESGIVLVTGERRLARWFAAERELEQEPAGCIVVEAGLARSPNLPRGRAILVVEDAVTALRALAAAARARHQGRVIAVAGNVGRTATRTMTAHLLGAHGPVATNFANGSLRLHVLEQMASVRPDTPYAVYELGLGGAPRAFADVSAVLRPDAVLLSGVDVAEVESPGRHDALLALAKRNLELCKEMAPEGTVVVHRDATIFDDIRAALAGRRIVSYGRDDAADYRLVRAEDAEGVSRVHAAAPGRELHFAVPARFMAIDGLGAVATAVSVGADVESAAERLASFEALPGHARPLRLTVGGAVVTVIDDSHNATPVTMRATLRLLGEARPGSGGRRIAVLGDVAHQGSGAEAVHAGLAEPVDRHDIDRVYTLGRGSQHLQGALPDDVRAGHFDTHEALVEALAADLRGGDFVAVKASAAAGFGRIVTMLRELDETPRPDATAPAQRPRAPELPPSRLLLDGETGETLFADHADRAHDPASLVKMMTLYLVFEELRAGRLDLQDEMVASALAARQPGSRLGLADGQSLSLHDAILALATVSANDVAVVVAEHLTDGGGVPAFVARMNARAAQFGLADTTFVSASGVFLPRQTATAADMGRLGFRLYSDFPGYRQWLAHPSMVFDGWRRPATNSLLTGYQGLNGVKTGTVSSGALRHLVGSAARGGRCFIGVVMGCRSVRHRDEEMTRLLDLGFASAAGEPAALEALGREAAPSTP